MLLAKPPPSGPMLLAGDTISHILHILSLATPRHEVLAG